MLKKALVRRHLVCEPIAVLALLIAMGSPAYADMAQAGRFFEDALGRYERGDLPGAIIQLKNSLQQDSKMLPAHLLLGKALLKNGDLKGAEAALEAALQQGVSPSEVIPMLGQVYLALGRPEAVIATAPAAGLPLPTQVEVLSMRGTAYIELGKSALAHQSFEAARKLDPRAVSPLIAEIPLLLSSNQLERAKQLASQAIELAPNNAFAWNMYASVLHAGMDLNAALTAYGRALGIEPKLVDSRIARAALLLDLKREADAKADLEYLAKKNPEEPRAAYLRALIASQHGDVSTTNRALMDVVKLVDALRPAWLARREQLLMVGALAHHGLGNPEKAREYLTILLARNPRNIEARKLLAGIYTERQDYTRALTLLGDLRRDVPGDPQVIFLLGTVHMGLRNYQLATDLLSQAAAKVNSGEVNRILAFSQLGLGQTEIGRLSLERAFAANPADVQAGMALAVLYMRHDEKKKAIQVAETVAKNSPGNFTVMNFLGSLKAANGDSAGARKVFGDLLNKDPLFPAAVLNMAKLDVSERKLDDARKRLTDFLAKRQDNSDAIYELGLLEFRAGKPAEAVRHLQKASELPRSDIRPGLALVEVYRAQRQFQYALTSAKRLASKFPDAPPVQVALGRAFLTMGDLANARSTLQSASRLAEYNADILLETGRLQLQANNSDAAFYDAQKALQSRPDDPTVMAFLVEIEIRRGASAKADEALKALAGRYPNHLLTALATGDLAMVRNQYPVALASYSKALELESSTANVLKVAQTYLRMGDTGKAITFLEGWVKRKPDDLVVLKTLGEAQFRAGQLQASKQSYAKAIEAEPDDAVALNNYANLLLKLKDASAQGMAERALKLVPDNPAYADTLGWILVQQGQLEAGLRYLREARLRSPEDGEIRYHLAYALSKSGRKTEAKEEMQAALAARGGLERTAEVNRLLAELGN
ncbi:XrtA/PEP-CTERM system TPR-repeat protein PrsT [Chitinimonas sp. BJB300]|uniref:XrtA/PEP-CTERM system TPR-repeat protein PrsT n=1 Tax=Chitinimonas sp. BJB300 TaxID=1559339 RepID=UPI001304264D|nr:XrtA/PEP-CTERM system TPR-repeat protein PrsT [Chitinimonas sp. BJB300]